MVLMGHRRVGQGLRRSRAYMANGAAIVVSWALGRIALSLGMFYHMFVHWGELFLIDRPGARMQCTRTVTIL